MLTHRIRLEQRWLGQLAEANARQREDWEYENRIRYQLQADLPLKGLTLDNKEFYLTFYDELFIGFGKNVQNNILQSEPDIRWVRLSGKREFPN